MQDDSHPGRLGLPTARGTRRHVRQLVRFMGQPATWIPLFLLIIATGAIRLVSRAFHDDDPCERPGKNFLQDMNIAVYETSGYHEEVLAGLVHTAERGKANTTTFRMGLRFGFEEILNKFHNKPLSHPDDMPRHIKDGDFDILVLASCETYWVFQETQAALRDYVSDLEVVCLHHEMWSFEHHRSNFHALAAQGRVNFLTISGHTHEMANKELERWSLQDGDIGWEATPSHLFIPVFPLTPSLDPAVLKKPKGINKVAVAGNIAQPRRWHKVFRDLGDGLLVSPERWGYAIRAPSSPDGNISAVPLPGADHFKLHVFGKDKGEFDIPPLIHDVMEIHDGLSYTDYYRLMSSMDLMVPAWDNEEYIHKRASASIPAALMTRVPTLINPIIARVYPYVDGPAVYVQPSSQGDVKSIRRWREHLPTWPADYPIPMPKVVAPLLSWTRSWLGGRDYWDTYHESMYQYNDRVFCRIAEKARRRRAARTAM